VLDSPQPRANARMNKGPRRSNAYIAIMKVSTTIPKMVRVIAPRYVHHLSQVAAGVAFHGGRKLSPSSESDRGQEGEARPVKAMGEVLTGRPSMGKVRQHLTPVCLGYSVYRQVPDRLGGRLPIEGAV